MIQIETLSGQIYDKIWLGESDYLYKDIMAKILNNIKNDYP